jgi:DHHC palmitoyltransferase
MFEFLGPWVNNCVGIGNQKLFLLFIFYTAVVCGYALALILSRFAACALNNLDCGSEVDFLMVLFLFLESLLFMMFTLCMLGDQLSSMRSNQTSIDRLKNQKHDIRVEVNEVCGSPIEVRFQLNWLLPVSVSFSDSLTERIFGYRQNPDKEYCTSCPGKEEATPLIQREDASAIEMVADSKVKDSKSESESKSSTQPTAAIEGSHQVFISLLFLIILFHFIVTD